MKIELYEHAPKDVTIPIMEIYDTALAYVAAGYREKWPQHIYQASSQLQKIQVGCYIHKMQKCESGVQFD